MNHIIPCLSKMKASYLQKKEKKRKKAGLYGLHPFSVIYIRGSFIHSNFHVLA